MFGTSLPLPRPSRTHYLPTPSTPTNIGAGQSTPHVMDERASANTGLVHDLVASSALRWPNRVAVHYYKDGPISSAASLAQGEASGHGGGGGREGDGRSGGVDVVRGVGGSGDEETVTYAALMEMARSVAEVSNASHGM